MGKISQRYIEFAALLEEAGKLELQEIQARFGVSESTARRMCIEAERDGLGIRVQGGGLQSLRHVPSHPEYSYEVQTVEHVPEKAAIGKYASSLVESNEIIFVSGGTTTQQFMKNLVRRLADGEIENVTIMTNSLLIIEMAEDFMPVILTGGQFRKRRRDVAGHISESAIRGARFDRSYIGVDGVELTDGLIASDNETGNMDRLVTARSDKVYILADHSKFTSKSYISYEHFFPKHIIITDSLLDSYYINLAKEVGVSLQLVDVDEPGADHLSVG